MRGVLELLETPLWQKASAPREPQPGGSLRSLYEGVHPPVQGREEAGARLKYQATLLCVTTYKNSPLCQTNSLSLQVHVLYF